jgi:hypothetical protein
MPNSIVQGLTTATPAGLNQLTSFQMVTLFGLMAHVRPKQPQKEVRIKVRDILEIARVSKSVRHAVERTWTTRDGRQRRKHYQGFRYSPRHLEQVHDALLALHNQPVSIHYFDAASGKKVKDHIVHILDCFGYCYRVKGQHLDVDDLPPDRERVNVGSGERPVWRVLRRAAGGDRYERPTAVTFRLNRELAREIQRCKHTVGFTLFAHRVFDLFRAFMRSPAAIRLLVLTLRQTEAVFTRRLAQLLGDLGFDAGHPDRAFEHLEGVLARLRDKGIVSAFTIDRGADRVEVEVDRGWYCEPGER